VLCVVRYRSVLWMFVSCECCVLLGTGLCYGCLCVVSVVCC